MDHRFGFRLDTLGQFIQNIGSSFIHSNAATGFPDTPLPERPRSRGLHLRLPVTGKLQPSLLEVQQHLFPAQFAFANPVTHGDQFLLPLSRSAHNDQEPVPLIFKTDIDINAICPQIHISFAAQVPLGPRLVVRF